MAIFHHNIDIGEVTVREGIRHGSWHAFSKSDTGSLVHGFMQTMLHICPELVIKCQRTMRKLGLLTWRQEVGVNRTGRETLHLVRLETAQYLSLPRYTLIFR